MHGCMDEATRDAVWVRECMDGATVVGDTRDIRRVIAAAASP
jgi:hypothetical protein